MKIIFLISAFLSQAPLAHAGNMSGGGTDSADNQRLPVMDCEVYRGPFAYNGPDEGDFSIFLQGPAVHQVQKYEILFTHPIRSIFAYGNTWNGLNLISLEGPDITFQNGGWQLQSESRDTYAYRSFAKVRQHKESQKYACYVNVPKAPDCDVVDCCPHNPAGCGAE